MTLVEVIDAARGLLGGEPLTSSRTAADNSTSFWTDNLLTTYHNIIQQELQQEIIQAFEDYFVTATFLNVVNGTAEYSLPSDFLKVRRLEDVRTPGTPLEVYPVTINERSSRTPGIFTFYSATNYANSYYLVGNQIVLTDTPAFTNSAALKLFYVQRVSDVTALTSTSPLPVETHRALVWGMVKYALFQQQSDTVQADAEYTKHLTRIKAQAEDRQIQRPRMVIRNYGPNQGGFV